jgi:hypothetical protein
MPGTLGAELFRTQWHARRAAPFLAAALIGAVAVASPALASPARASPARAREAASARHSAGSTSASRVAARHSSASPDGASPDATAPAADTPTPASGSSASPVLAQTPGNQWQVTVQVFNTGGTCPAGVRHDGDYLLETTLPARVLAASQATEVAAPPAIATGVTSCEVQLTFPGPQRVPATATLVIDGASTLSLTISRDLPVWGYLATPLEFGGALAAGLLILAMFIRLYRPDGKKKQPFWRPRRKGRSIFGDFWKHQLTAASAWSLNDSWATNIAASAAVLTTILGLTTTDTLFRGLLLDRFSILMAVAGAIAAAAPLLFGLLYAFWITRNPGLTDNAVVMPPPCLKATLSSPSHAGQQAQGRTVFLVQPSAIRTRGAAEATLPRGTPVTLPHGTLIRFRPWPHRKEALPAAQAHAMLGAEAMARLTDTVVTPPVYQPGNVSHDPIPAGRLLTEAMLPAGATLTLLPGAALALPDGRKAGLADQAGAVTLPAGARATLISVPEVDLTGQQQIVPGQPDPNPDAHRLGPGSTAQLSRLGYQASDATAANLTGTRITAHAGAKVTAPWGATAAGSSGPPAAVKPGAAILLPPGATLLVLAGNLEFASGSDILLLGTSMLRIIISAAAASAATLTIGADSQAAPPGHPASDIGLPGPVDVTLPEGATVTVSGVAEVTLPAGTQIQAPDRRPRQTVSHERTRFRWPASSGSSLVGTMGMVIATAMVTVFGIGAELGIAWELGVGLSTASGDGRWALRLILAFIGLFVLAYGIWSIRALADPEPGSSLSSAAGTSFTL